MDFFIYNFNFNHYINYTIMQKNFQDRILKLKEYNPCVEIYGGKIIVNVTFKKGWKVISPKETIKIAVDENIPNKYFFYSEDTTDLNEILEEIDKTILYNNEIELKKELLISKINELKQLFETEPMEVLKTIEFKLKKKNKKIENIKIENNENNNDLNE